MGAVQPLLLQHLRQDADKIYIFLPGSDGRAAVFSGKAPEAITIADQNAPFL